MTDKPMRDPAAHPGPGEHSEYYAIEAEGHRIGLAACLICGAVVLLDDPVCNSPAIRADWHRNAEAR